MTGRERGGWRESARSDWTGTPGPVWAVIFVLDAVGLAAAALQGVSVASAGARPWASYLSWVLAGAGACAATLAAASRARAERAVTQTWLLFVAGAACWTAGALVRFTVPPGQESLTAGILFLALPACCLVSYARRVPRPLLFVLFLLDAVPVVLLVLAFINVFSGVQVEPLGNLFTGLYVLLAANAIQMLGIHEEPFRMPIRIRLFTLAFCVLAFAAVFAGPHKVAGPDPLALWVSSAWTLGMLLLGTSAIGQIVRPAGFVVLRPAEKQIGPHAITPAIAVLGLIVLLVVYPAAPAWLRIFLLAAALLLLIRVTLVFRQDVRLIAEVVDSRERLRQLVKATSGLKSLILAELLARFCGAAQEVLGVSYAAVELTGPGPGERHRASSGRAPPGELVGVPVTAWDTTRGTLHLAAPEGGFSEEDQSLAELLAADRGYAIENAELYAESQRQQAQLAAQNERLREVDRLKDEFIALVSHELRTPLTSIIGYVELLREEDPREQAGAVADFAAIIDRNAHRLLRLVGDLLFLSRIQSGKIDIEPRDGDLAEIAASAVEEAGPAAEERHITLTRGGAAHLPARCDPTRIGQLLDNLISNALKFTPAGGKVSVRVEQDGPVAVLAVADTGCGIPAADQDRIFERFYRSEAAAAGAIQGTGLGLTICKAIAEAHQGTIAVRSEEGRGTEFLVRLPLRAQS